ncbi:MAG: tyrosine-type recombinase/integrase [Alphaproteobacteria bacterium]
MNFTKAALEAITPPKKPKGKKGGVYDTYYDTGEKGLILLASNGGAKTFYLYRKVNGKPERIRLGSFSDIKIEQARKAAVDNRSLINSGVNPNIEKSNLKAETTLGELFEEFMERYSKKYKKSWKYDEREIPKFLSHWFNRKISNIGKQEIQRFHEEIRNNSGLYQANRTLERLRAMYNKAIEWGWEGLNPTQGIKKFKEKSRDRFIRPDELPRFFQALEKEESTVAKDYIYVSLFTGARKGNVLEMRWNEINLERAEWRIPETKNGDSQTIPLIKEVVEILARRKNTNKAGCGWVFPSPTGSKAGHLADPQKAWKRILKTAGIENLRIHDIRRTLGSYQAITGASLPVIGKSLGHKSQTATQIYARMNLDPVRASIEKAAGAMLANIGEENE